MMGLTDRLEPWTRRFHGAPAPPAAAAPAPAGDGGPEDDRPARTRRFARPAAAEPPATPTGRWAGGALQDQER